MIPILYESTETEFKSNGLGRLRECTRCEVVEERNGIYEVEFDYPVNGSHYKDIVMGRILACEHDETNEPQPFDIYGCTKPINGIVTFKGQHISYRQRGIVAYGKDINNITDAFYMLRQGKPSNPFSYESDVSGNGYMSSADGTPRSVREFLGGIEGSVLDTYGGEYEFDKWTVKLLRNRGEDRNFTIRYGVNMIDYSEDMDYSGAYTAVVPFWIGDDTIVRGGVVNSNATPYDGRTTCVPLDLSDKFESAPTAEQLEALGLSYMNTNQTYMPSRNIKVDFVRLQDSDEFHQFANLQKCRLCDSVKVVFPMYDIEATFKIVRVVWDVLLERYIEMELGNLSTTLAEALGISDSSGASVGTATYESGTITGSSVSANSYKDYNVTFTKTFSAAPIVVACFQSTSTAGAFGNCTLGIVSTSSTGFTVRVFNGDSQGRGPNINWVAIKS